jgi:hypothetical protein
MSLMEVLYRVWRDEGEAAGRLAYEQCLALPIVWLHETPELLKRAAAIKAESSSVGSRCLDCCVCDRTGSHPDPQGPGVQGGAGTPGVVAFEGSATSLRVSRCAAPLVEVMAASSA